MFRSIAARCSLARSPILSYGYAENQNVYRPYMEDRCLAIPCLSSYLGNEKIPKHVPLFAVFDGHGGSVTSSYAQEHLPKLMGKYIASKYEEAGDCGINMHECLELSLEETNNQIHKLEKPGIDGSTAVICTVYNNSIWSANLGDSRAMLFRNSSSFPLTEDHTPEEPSEKQRIESLGGKVECVKGDTPRIYWAGGHKVGDGGLNLSRALGDEFYQKDGVHLVSSIPDIRETPIIKESDDFVVLVSDGFLEWKESEDIMQIADKLLQLNEFSTKDVCDHLLRFALSKSTDNITCVLFTLNKE